MAVTTDQLLIGVTVYSSDSIKNNQKIIKSLDGLQSAIDSIDVKDIENQISQLNMTLETLEGTAKDVTKAQETNAKAISPSRSYRDDEGYGS